MSRRPVALSMFPDLVADKPVGPMPRSVLQGGNADLIFNVAPLYLTGSVMDVTYGRGGWWQRFTPDPFTRHDLYTLDGVDFRALPEADRSVDTVCFDPPYTISGSKSTSTAGGFLDRYGIGDKPGGAVYRDILDGLTEACRVARSWVLVKCMEFAQGGVFHDIPFEVTAHARTLDWRKHDQFVHHTGCGPGGHNIFDVKRARRHHSYLIVLGAPS